MEWLAPLECIHKYSKLIALVAAIFLVCSTLDNIPDCPELLDSTAGTTALANAAVHHASTDLNPVYAATGIVPPPTLDNKLAAETQPGTLPCWVSRSLHQAADPSPPSA